MDAVKDYWKSPLFLIGVFFCGIGTISAITGAHHIGVLSELIGFTIIVIAIFLLNKNSENSHH